MTRAFQPRPQANLRGVSFGWMILKGEIRGTLLGKEMEKGNIQLPICFCCLRISVFLWSMALSKLVVLVKPPFENDKYGHGSKSRTPSEHHNPH